ncbi:type VI secretion system tip protein TssI/VgrG [Alteromonadaceae bacterium BrNp21-10]|nr:type VI secretion system tip protein TssI/VgrG [Alteromonadaceae bacterium BrNp21-10]
MTEKQRVDVTFFSEEFDKITESLFQVIGFEGFEAISEPFHFDLDLISAEPDIKLEKLVGKTATLEITRHDSTREIHGVILSMEQGEETQFGYYSYKAILVPRIRLMSLSRQNQIYQDTNIPGIVTQEIAPKNTQNGKFSCGLAEDDLDFRIADATDMAADSVGAIESTAPYPIREYVVQYQESDLNFVSRLLEHEGIYYYFEHKEGRDQIVFCDNLHKLDSLKPENVVSYVPPSGLASFENEAIHSFRLKQNQISHEILLKDFNYRYPHIPIQGNAETGDLGHGLICEYGDHFKGPYEGGKLAQRRAEIEICKQKTFQGISNALLFEAGKLIEIVDHYREDFNHEYLITKIHHRAGQALPGVAASNQSGSAIAYQNNFDAIPSDIEFRPVLKTPKPKMYGILNATIDGAIDSDRAQIDEEGRYKLIMPFDISGNAEGKASRWVRKAESFGGQGTGMNFPLLKGTEVIWSCINGDPDRPIITGVVPNPLNKSMVTAINSTDNVIKTPSGIIMQMRDGKGTAPSEQSGTEKPQTRMNSNAAHLTNYMSSIDNSASLIQQQQHIEFKNAPSRVEIESGSDFRYGFTAKFNTEEPNIEKSINYSLTDDAPIGMSITTDGLLKWTAGAPKTYTATIQAQCIVPAGAESKEVVRTITKTLTIIVTEASSKHTESQVVKDDLSTAEDETQKSYSITLPHYRTGTGNKHLYSYSRIGAFHIDELDYFDNVYYRPGTFNATTGMPEGQVLSAKLTEASDGGHKIMDVLNATRATYNIPDSTTWAAGLYESLDPKRFGLMEYTDGAKLMVHWNGCFDLAAGTSVTYDSLGTKDSLISVVLGEKEEGAAEARMVKSERFHYGGTSTGNQWVTETWENVNSYSYNYGQQHSMFVGMTYDYKVALSFEALLGGSVECSFATKTAFCLGINAEVKLAADINWSRGPEINLRGGDSIEVSSGNNENKGNVVLLQYEPTVVTEASTTATCAAYAGVAATLASAVTTVGLGMSGTNQGNVKTGALVNQTAAGAVSVAAAAVQIAGLVAWRKNTVATKATTKVPIAVCPFVKVEKDKITLKCGAASIVLDGLTGEIKIGGTIIDIEGKATAKIKSKVTEVAGDATLNLKGKVTKLEATGALALKGKAISTTGTMYSFK